MKDSTKQILKLIQMSVSYLMVFLAFNGLRFSSLTFHPRTWLTHLSLSLPTHNTGTQTIMSSLLPGNLGYWSIACIYITFTLSSLLLSSAFVIAVTVKWSLFIGGLLYLGFIVANIWPDWVTLVPGALVLGIGASIIWAAQGAYVTNAALAYAHVSGKPPRSSVGLFNGIFFGIFQLSMLIGNLISSLILSSGGSSGAGSSSGSALSSDEDSWSASASESLLSASSSSAVGINPRAKLLFYSYTCICGAGVIGLLLLPKPGESHKAAAGADEAAELESKQKIKNPLERVIGAVVLLKEPRMFLMVPYLLFTGLEQAFVFGDFTKQFVRELHGVQNVGFVMSVFGVVDSVFSFVLGRLADRIGARWIGYTGAALLAVFLGTIRFFRTTAFGVTIPAAFMWAALLGIADACMFGVFCNAATATLFHDRAEAAFSNVKVFQAGGTALMFFLGPILTFNIKIIIISATLVIAVIAVVILDTRVFPLRPQTQETPEPSQGHVQHKASETAPLIADKSTSD